MKTRKTYYELLDGLFSNYSGTNEKLLRRIPVFFKLLQKIYVDNTLKWEIKFKINSCFSYFAIPDDVIPDKSNLGYIDDLFICSYVLNDIVEENPELINKTGIDENVLLIIKETHTQTRELLGEKTVDILSFVGLLKFNDLAENSGFIFDSENLQSRLGRLDEEIFALLSLLRSILITQGNKHVLLSEIREVRFKGIKKLFDDKEWDKAIDILANLELHEVKFDNAHELELEKIKRKILLEIDANIMVE